NALIFLSLKQTEAALRELMHASEIRETLPDSFKGSLLDGFAYYYAIIGDFESSIKYFHEALEIARSANASIYESACWNGLSKGYRELGRFEDAVKTADKSLEIATSIGHPIFMLQARESRASAYEVFDEEQALKLYEEALSFAEKADVELDQVCSSLHLKLSTL